MTTMVTLASPVCTILAVQSLTGVSTASALEQSDPNGPGGWKDVGTISPRLGFTADVYAINETWVKTPSGPIVIRAQAHPATRPAFMDKQGSAWSINAHDASFNFSGIFAFGTANQGNELDSSDAGAETVPQLMTVGSPNNQQVFACAGGRSENDRVRTTLLFEIQPPTGSPPTGGRKVFIQDLLNGDDAFVPNAPGPLRGPANPPTPTITNRPGSPVTSGSVQCAMTQLDDDVATRKVHMLAIDNGVLYHSVASNFSTATTGNGFILHRFNTVSPWADVSQALGLNFGTIVASAIVASRPTAVSVFFVAEAGGRYRLYHTVRFDDGSWRPPDDVFVQNGATLNGTNYSFKVAAGMCPVMGQPMQSELVYAIWKPDETWANIGRVVSAPQQWPTGEVGIYSPFAHTVPGSVSDPARQPILRLWVTSRPAP
jgi:hypothetical protein